MAEISFQTQIICGIYQSALTMRAHGLSDKKIKKRLRNIGFQQKFVSGVMEELPGFLEQTHGQGRLPGPSRVFISHSHKDRKTASYIQKILQKNDVPSFLDQHQIVAGQDLKDRLLNGIIWCEKLLLFWSRHAKESEYVQWEWQHARLLMKEIVPYKLDQTQLPPELHGQVFVSIADQKHGHAELFRSILGRGWKPDETTPFPGYWHAELSLAGFGQAEYELELRANGQIIGTGRIKEVGFAGRLAHTLGVSQILSMKIPITGTWSYKDRENILEFNITATFMNQISNEVVNIYTSGKERGWLQGQTLGGLPWRLRRER
jgi:hypothetical protein